MKSALMRNAVAKDLRTPKYRMQVIANKKKEQSKRACRDIRKGSE